MKTLFVGFYAQPKPEVVLRDERFPNAEPIRMSPLDAVRLVTALQAVIEMEAQTVTIILTHDGLDANGNRR